MNRDVLDKDGLTYFEVIERTRPLASCVLVPNLENLLRFRYTLDGSVWSLSRRRKKAERVGRWRVGPANPAYVGPDRAGVALALRPSRLDDLPRLIEALRRVQSFRENVVAPKYGKERDALLALLAREHLDSIEVEGAKGVASISVYVENGKPYLSRGSGRASASDKPASDLQQIADTKKLMFQKEGAEYLRLSHWSETWFYRWHRLMSFIIALVARSVLPCMNWNEDFQSHLFIVDLPGGGLLYFIQGRRGPSGYGATSEHGFIGSTDPAFGLPLDVRQFSIGGEK
jgi:hypothetical protein